MTREELKAEAERCNDLAEESAGDDPIASEMWSVKAQAARVLAAYTPEDEE